MTHPVSLPPLTVTPIGYARTPFADRVSAPRQPYAADRAPGTIELIEGHNFEHALEDLAGFDHIWVIFWFHLNESWKPKVLPPRSTEKRGVFATRSPYRPNPLGLSVLSLERISGLTLHVRDLDLIDQTPILDIKPYVPVADALPTAASGWLEPRDPQSAYTLIWSPKVEQRLRWLADTHNVHLAGAITKVLSIGPEPHPYRRIRPHGSGYCLAVKDWRVVFTVEGRTVSIESLGTGYGPRDLATSTNPAVDLHRTFLARFGES